MKLYFVSAIVQNPNDTKPWLCAASEGKPTFSDALDLVDWMKKNYTLMSVWVDAIENSQKDVVFHECYLDCFGGVN